MGANASDFPDELYQALLEEAGETIKDLTHLDEVPTSLASTQVEIAIISVNKLGIEGQVSHQEGGVNRNYVNDLPRPILRRIRAHRRLP